MTSTAKSAILGKRLEGHFRELKTSKFPLDERRLHRIPPCLLFEAEERDRTVYPRVMDTSDRIQLSHSKFWELEVPATERPPQSLEEEECRAHFAVSPMLPDVRGGRVGSSFAQDAALGPVVSVKIYIELIFALFNPDSL